jgi:acyl transferase domain-containing protein/SAM-dependent methyltransferase
MNDIAILAISGRFAGSPTVEALWANLRDGKECIRRYDDDELLAMGVSRLDLADPRFVRAGAALDGIDRFDAPFFGILPRYAELLDPQQRILLECAWELIERGGYDPDSYDGAIGVYVGAGRSMYQQGKLRSETERMVAYSSHEKDYTASRLSYKLNLKGPSLTVQSASSTSLAAVHLACESLNNGECDMAIAGGVCIVLPQAGYTYDESVMFSPDGHCRAFDASAAGTVPGNGSGLVLLKRLDDAQRDGDQILAVIKGSAMNNDGAQKMDFYAPSVDGQARVIREALSMAEASPDSISYIEAHGTGTPLGDPVEIAALRQVFQNCRPGAQCAIGALKPNIGHLHTASGVAGLIKVVLMLQHRELVPTLHFDRLNPHIDLTGTPFAIQTERRPWTAPGPLRAGVTALGLGGTNVHVIVEEAPSPRPSPPASGGQSLPLSARSPEALAAASENLARHLEGHPDLNLADVAYTLRVGRKSFEHRRVVACRTREEAIAALRNPSAIATPPVPSSDAGRRRVLLPTYPFERKSYWIPQHAAETAAVAVATPPVAIDLDRLRHKMAAVLGIDAALVGPDRPFQEIGLESTVAPLLALELNEAFGVRLDPTDFYNHGTIRDLAAHLATQARVPEPRLQPAATDRRIAVIGMSGRFPGAPNLRVFRDRLAAGATSITGHPPAGRLDHFDCFDAPFFRISPSEAQSMDPQQRLFLEECWKALEDAACLPADLESRRVGVFAGAQPNDYAASTAPGEGTIGNSLAILSGRVSYYLNLKGPTLTVDTACSSSLVALHLACQSLWSGESEIALAGGVSCCLFSPAGRDFFESAGMLSTAGACRPFDAAADGMVPADAVGVVLLKPLADALHDGDPIRAVISGIGVNHDGRTAGITAPSAPSQTALLRDVYQRFAIDPATIGYVEAHGTGTRLGDPIEVQALTDAFRASTTARQFCAIGSVKANIGHALPAAGVAGLITAIVALEQRRIPPAPGFRAANPLIRFDDGPFYVSTQPQEWQPRPDAPRRAAVSSFGFSGTNAHVVVDEAPSTTPPAAPTRPHYLVALSARTPDALRARIDDLADWLRDAPPAANLRDVSYTLNACRTHFDHRAAFVARDLADLASQLAMPSPPEDARLRRALDDYLKGADLDCASLYAGETPRRLSLPAYAFDRVRYWLDRPEPARAEAPAPPRPNVELLETLRGIIATELYLEPAQVADDASFLDLGLDSILAVELAKRVKEELGVEIRATRLYESGTLRDLAAHLAPQSESPAPAAPALAPPTRVDDIAIIGVSGRYPMADDLDEFWRNLRDGRDCITEIPADRWDLDGFFAPAKGADGRSYSKWGGFLRDTDKFDALFFQIAPRDAELMDPQERLFLETAWSALEDAGYSRDSLGPDREVGVFAGVMYGEYQVLAADEAARGKFVPAYSPYWSIANRVSYVLNLRGPSMAVDTACSSSLTAIHLACESLRRGECRLAIAGGVNLSLHPRKYLGLSHARFASTDGRCRSFGEGGDGYVPGEGVGALILKPLAQAIADGDHIHAVIKSTAINHGGKATGYSVPTASAQSAVIAKAIGAAGIAPESIGYLEAHGTGTSLGDPIEVEGIAAALHGARCALGSVKSNIGHLEAAAGVAAITKVILQMRHGKLAPSLHADRLNPELRLEGSLFVNRELADWPAGTRRAGVSSFGAGGANAHAILEEFASTSAPEQPSTSPRAFVLSARTPERLRVYAARLAAALPSEPLADIAYTLRVGREPLPFRLAIVAATRADLIARLDAFQSGRAEPGIYAGEAAPDRPAALPLSADEAARAFVAGAPVDWSLLDATRRKRISLPTYPFERKRYWLPRAETRRPSLTPGAPAFRDHKVAGRSTLPAVCYLELARAKHFRDIVWMRPLVANGHAIDLDTRFDGDRFEVLSDGQTHCAGTVAAAEAPATDVDLDAIRRRCADARGHDEIYRAFEQRGVSYGETFRLIDRLHIGTHEALAEITTRPDGAELNWLDAAGQAAAGCCWDEGRDATFAPFSADRIDLHGAPNGACFAHVRRLESTGGILRFDVAVADAHGRALASIRNLALKPIGDRQEPLQFLEPTWVEEPLRETTPLTGAMLVVRTAAGASLATAVRAANAGRVIHEAVYGPQTDWPTLLDDAGVVSEILFLGIHTGPTTLAQAEQDGVLTLLRLAQAWIVRPSSRGAVLRVVTNGVHRVLPQDSISPWAAAAIGLAKVLVNEVSTVHVQCIDLPADPTPADVAMLASEPAESRVFETAYREGRRYLRRARIIDPPAALSPFRDRGVYLIVGGAGGLGMALARYLARNFAARIAIVGRAPEAFRQDTLREIEAQGGEALYCRADVADAAQLRAAVATVKQKWGRIDGAVHSALVLEDRGILRMDETSFRAALDPKAKGAIALHEALGDEARDFLAFFSSANSLYGNAGQSNYVAGCVFQDAFGAYLNASGKRRVTIVNWGFWGEVGAVASAAMRARLAKQGLFSIGESEGIDAFVRLLGSGLLQGAAVKATPETLRKLGVVETAPSPLVHQLMGLEQVEEYGRLYLQRVLAGMDLDRIIPQYARLRDALLAMLRRHGWTPGATEIPTVEELQHCKLSLLASDPVWTPYIQLLDACLSRYPEVLQGRLNHMEAMFPKGSLHLVEGIYRGNALTDYYNDLLAKTVAEHIDRAVQTATRKLRIVEIGAGTGGTTRGLLPLLRPHAARLEYVYTDLSSAFLRAAENRFAADYPFVQYRILDIEKDVVSQGLALGECDIVIAANVIHATRHLRESLRECRRLLRPDGLLVLNESLAVRDFATLTFGLTTGWWRFEDHDSRAPHSPVASEEQWRRALTESGFDAPRFFAGAIDRPFQAIIVSQAAAAAEPLPQLHQRLIAIFADILKLDAEPMRVDDPFDRYGVESVTALEIVARLEQEFGDLPKTLLFEHNTIASLAAFLDRDRRPAPPQPTRSSGDLAIVGLSGRYPGADTLDEFWQNLRAGKDSITEIPPERWSHSPHYDPTRRDETKAYSRHGGFLRDVECFDAPLFRLSPHDARLLDPQERLFLETVWTLLDDAGYSPDRLARAARTEDASDVGVFVGVMNGLYETLSVEQWTRGNPTGAYSSHSSIANRVSYWFDFHGPSLGIDTACSSSLTAIHLAAESIRRGECRAAIAGGVNLLLHPLHHVLLSYYRVLTPAAETRPFGADADGFVVGEGVGAVLLRPLEDAIRDGDRIYAVLKGSAVNTCGRTSSYSAPSAQAQAEVIAAAMRRCGVDPRTISYIEAHGTGTELGDPVEIRGLQKAFESLTPDAPRQTCAIGSVKANIGHLEAASGIAGLTKLLLQFHHGELAPSLHAATTNPLIDFGATPFRLQQTASEWKRNGYPRRAGVSSFGMGGANAHLVLEEYVAPAAPTRRASTGPQLIVFSANTDERLRVSLAQVRDFLNRAPSLPIQDIACTLQLGRQALDERWAAVVNDTPDLVRCIDDYLAGRPDRQPVFAGNARAGRPAARPAPGGDLAAIALAWTQGAPVDWDAVPRAADARRISLPSYPFERKRYWLTDARPESAVAAYYDATAEASPVVFDETYLSLAPFAEPVPGFSWARAVFEPDQRPQDAALLLEKQRELRRVLFRDIDWTRTSSVFDFGCGLGTDLILLAQRHPHLRVAGYSISSEHARIAAGRIRAERLQDRVTVAPQDSAVAPFPGVFDVIFGIEVAHHIQNKEGLFANIAGHLSDSGRLLLVDCLSQTVTVQSAQTGSFTLNAREYAGLLARHELRIVECIDASREIANCLHDDDLDDVLAGARARGSARIELVETVHRSWDHFGKALASGLMRYVLIAAEKSASPNLVAENLRALEHARGYSDQPAVVDILRRRLIDILQIGEAELASNRSFADLGLDSLSGLKFVDAINQDLGLNLGAEVIYDHPTLPALSEHLRHVGRAILPAAGFQPAPDLPTNPNDIAIVGVSVRFPGAHNLEQFWDNLAAGRDSVTEVPSDRWDTARHYSPDPERLDKTVGKWAGLLSDYDRFDASFFNVSPREAEYMDPQQRLFLEESWKALEDAGYPEIRLSGMRCGVYAGVLGNEYQDLVRQNRPPDAYVMLGNSASILAARISYFLNLKGPSLSIDTACSSSLVAVDLACKALQRGDIDLALAGGVALYLSERPFIQMSRAGLLSRDGKCRAFDHRADGIAPGEGVGVVALKRLRDALADRDHVYGVIRASATNQDGRTNGITAPSAASQTSLIQSVCEQAKLDPATIGCVEAHGTGTPLGDPIEVTALAAAYGARTTRRQYCALGSVKSNIGHTSAAAGIAGLAKLLVSFEHRQLPPSLHFEVANQRIPLPDTPFYVNTKLREWEPLPGSPRRAALSSFGFSGTNAHLIVDEAPAPSRPPRAGWHIATISAKTAEALDQRVRDLAAFLERKGGALALADVCFTLNVGREHFPIRRAFVADNVAHLIAQLRGRADTAAPDELLAIAARFLSGADIDWEALYKDEPVWRVSLPAYPFSRDRYWCDTLPMLFRPEWVPMPLGANPRAVTPLCITDARDLDAIGAIPEAIVCTEDTGPESIFLLVQAISERRQGRPVRIAFVYRRDGSVSAARHASVAAMAKSLALVDTGVELVTVGVDADTDSETAIRRASDELAQPHPAAEARYEGGARSVRVIRERQEVQPATIALRRGSVVVITGGLGGMPYLFARELALTAGACLVLIGRAALDSARREKIRALEASGAEVFYCQADVSDEAALAAALRQARQKFGSIDAVLHAAGFIGSTPWLRKPIEEFRAVFAAKARGAELLDELTRQDDLQFFAMFSSLASSVGDFGEGDYAAGNRFLSEFADTREAWRARGLRRGRTVSIEWPMWDEGGIRFPEQGKALFLSTTGMSPLTAREGVPVLGAVLAANDPCVLVASGDRDRLTRYLGGNSAPPSPAPPSTAPQSARAAETFSNDLTRDLREIMAGILRIPPAQINPSVSFSEYGFDSIILKEFATTITRRLGITVSPVRFFAAGTLRELVACLAEERPQVPPPAAEPVRSGAIAVIGMSGVFPQSPDLDAYWQNLLDGRDLVTPAPAGRAAPGPAGFIDDPYAFDADFFQISAQEAEVMDPQHRILLETVWKAVEHAGYRPLGLAGARAAIFVGAQASDFLHTLETAEQPQIVTGSSDAMLANRISYLLDWRGPSEVVDTACSSSLVAVHRAVQALRNGEADLAVAGGVSLLLSRKTSEAVGRMGVLSPNGRCKVFDRSADGYVRGEGAGAVLLKPLDRAIADGDRIHGVILGSGVNHGGRATSLTAPNPQAQAELLASVWARAGVAPATISYIEAHGTGTELGDPIEIQAMQTALAGAGVATCGTGSVKSNIGHLEPASGIASLVKILLSFERGVLPPTLHCREVNPHMRLEGGPVFLVTSATPWTGPAPRRAGVSSFGFGGVNAHVLLEEPPATLPADLCDAGPQVVVLSARTSPALRRYAELLRAFIAASPAVSLGDLAYTLQVGRDAFEHRLTIVCDGLPELASKLDTFLAGGSAPGISLAASPVPVAMRELLHSQAPHTASGGRRRLSLPTYPFEHKKTRPRTTTLTPQHPWVRDHQVQGHGVLAGAAILEMVRAASPRPLVSLRGVTWLQSVVVEAGGCEVAVRFRQDHFEFASADGATVYAQGEAVFGDSASQPRVLHVAELQSACSGVVEGPDLYRTFAESGLQYGPTFRRLERVWTGESAAIGEIASADSDNPAVLDAAMQAAATLLARGSRQLLVPFSFEELTVSGNLSLARFVWVRSSKDPRFDLSIADSTGNVLAEWKGLYARAWRAPEEAPLSLFTPVWRESALPSAGAPGRALIFRTVADFGLSAALRDAHAGEAVEVFLGSAYRKLSARAYEIDHRQSADYRRILDALPARDVLYFLGGLQPTGDEIDLRALDSAQQTGVLSLFRLTQALWSADRLCPIRVVTNNVQSVLPGDRIQPESGALSGFCRALAQELTAGSVSCVDLREQDLDDASLVTRRLASERDLDVAYRADRRYVRSLQPASLAVNTGAPLRQGGVYCIVGGAGGLGAIFAKHLAAHYSARLILTGRRPSGSTTDRLIAEIRALGGDAIYRQADAADLDAMRAEVADAKARWGGVNGVVCSALVLRNATIPKLSEADFADAFPPKAHASIVLENVFRGEALDFIALFSSAISLTQAAGQSNYAAASSFQDAVAPWLATRLGCPVKTVNWGYWGEQGIVATPEHRERMRSQGVGSIRAEEGIATFERLLASDCPQLVVARLLANPAPTSAPVRDTPDYLKRIFAEIVRRDPNEIDVTQTHETLGIDSLVMIQIIRRLEQDLGPLPKTLLFEHTSIRALSDWLEKQHREPVSAPAVRPATGDIAIVGLSGKYPMAATVEEFWENLRSGRNCITEIPSSRWDYRPHFDEKGAPKGKIYTKWGGFLDEIDRFDALFFGISAREAAAMDPQERLFLETAWATLEDAGHTRKSLAGGNVGVFVGVMQGNYQLLGANSPYWSIANRVSYWFDYHGPSMAVDTACSSSLTALHLACESIRRGECRAAIAGGVNLIVHPRQYVVLSAMKMLSHGPEGRSFGADADGFVLGEGVGAVLLRPLEDALKDGDRIYAVVKSSAINAGGKTPGYTVPSPEAQTALVGRALEDGRIDPSTITYVEAHGTGTALGDPIEVAALTKAFRRHTDARQFCALGSVKSNVGHLEAAAGIAALTKVLLQLQHGILVPTLHSGRRNPDIDFENSPFDLPQEVRDWRRPSPEIPRRAGISSFGAGGTNVHVIVEEAPPVAAPVSASGGRVLVPLSARTKDRLREQARQLAEHLRRHPELRVEDVSHTLRVGREAMAERVVFSCADLGELSGQLSDFLSGRAVVQGDGVEAVGRKISLPTYPFERQRHWVKAESEGPLVKELDGSEYFLTDHRVGGDSVLPGVAHLEWLRAAVAGVRGFSSVTWLSPVVVTGARRVEIPISRIDGETLGYEVRSEGETHGRGKILLGAPAADRPRFDLESIRARCGRRWDGPRIYGSDGPVFYGPRFQVLRSIRSGSGEAISELAESADPIVVLDAALQSSMGVLTGGPLLPFAADRVEFYAGLEDARHVYVRGGAAQLDVSILDADGLAVAAFQGVVLRAPKLKQPLSESEALERLEEIGRLWLLEVFPDLRPAPKYEKLMDALRAMVARMGPADPAKRARAQRELLRDHPAFAPHVTLLERCLSRYPEILRGEFPATEAFFPGGSMETVEAIYRGSGVAEHFHRTVAEAVRAAMERVGGRPARILEIGAGTGGTTVRVLEAIAGSGVPVEFHYTDVSPGFTHHGKAAFGRKHPFVKFAVLDIEKEVEGQGFQAGAMDVVYASNVLHATRNIRETLAHARSLLAPGGTLVLNEMTAARDFATLTFGLLDGWFRYEDAELRIPHSPLLSVAGWTRVMRELGMEVAATHGEPGESDPARFQQSVLVYRRIERPAPVVEGGSLLASIEDGIVRAVAEVFEMTPESVRAAAGLDAAHAGSARMLSFTELGADSILSAELVEKVSAALGISLKTTAIFNYPGIRELAGHIFEEYGVEIAAQLGSAAPAPRKGNGHSATVGLEEVLAKLESGEWSYEDALNRYVGDLIQ